MSFIKAIENINIKDIERENDILANAKSKVQNSIIVALDGVNYRQMERIVEKSIPFVKTFKLGISFWNKEVDFVISLIKGLGGEVLVDLNWFEVPSQIDLALPIIQKKKIDAFTVSGLLPQKDLKKIVKFFKNFQFKPKVIGTTTPSHYTKKDVETIFHRSLGDLTEEVAERLLESGVSSIKLNFTEAELLRRNPKWNNLGIIISGCRSINDIMPEKTNHSEICHIEDVLKLKFSQAIIGNPILEDGGNLRAIFNEGEKFLTSR